MFQEQDWGAEATAVASKLKFQTDSPKKKTKSPKKNSKKSVSERQNQSNKSFEGAKEKKIKNGAISKIKKANKFKEKRKLKAKLTDNKSQQTFQSPKTAASPKKIAEDKYLRRKDSKSSLDKSVNLNASRDSNSGKKKTGSMKKRRSLINVLGGKKTFEIYDDIKEKKNDKEGSLRDRMIARLESSRFRFLNEKLYNNESTQSKEYFKEEPEAFKAYHQGYKRQMERWPVKPLDIIIEAVKKLPQDYVVADFGCGEARLEESVEQKVHSIDLIALKDNVIACDMAHTPLLTNSVNVVVFCLSLMGSNLGDYIKEAHRILKKDGILKVAEIESRFADVDDFMKTLTNYGFVNTWKDLSHDLFYFFDFKKTNNDLKESKTKLPSLTLKSCLYKKR